MAKYDILLTDDEHFHEQFNLFCKEIYRQQGYNVIDYPVNFAAMQDYPVPGHNVCMETIDIDAFGRPAYDSFSIDTYSSRHYSKITKTNDTTYPCLVRIETKVKPYQSAQYIEDTIFYKYLLVSNNNTGLTFDYYSFPYTGTWNRGLYPYNKNGTDLTIGTPAYWDKMRYPYGVPYTLYNIISVDSIINDLNVTEDYQAHLNSLLSSYGNFYCAKGDLGACGFPYRTNRNQSPSTMHQQVLFISRITELPEWLPIFDAENVEGIKKYLQTGDDSGKIDPFDPNTPQKEFVEDFKTNFRVFVTPNTNDSNVTHFSFACYNNDFRDGGEEFRTRYKMVVKRAYDLGAWETLKETEQAFTPVYSFNYTFPKTDRQTSYRVYFADTDETSTSTIFDIVFLRDDNSKVNCKVNVVYQTNEVYTTCQKSNIIDGYKYTANTGEYVDIIFRGIGVTDLTDGYTDIEDIEDDKGGTDSDFFGASGLHTFSIDNSDLSIINKKLWSTDWATVFKSNTIDPIKSIIGCKAIPFTADNVSSAEVIIANLDTGLSKNYVKTVKSYNVGNCTIEPLYKDFTDVSLTRVHCYLPFVGWVELPASEVMSRYEYASYGISARIKTLGFKYLVDFVDGSVKVIISVNNTERWIFDGNCAVDIPLTSDNHTQAVRNAIQSAISTTMSIGSIVAGAYSGNAGAVAGGVVGTITNAPDIFPTYNYSASATGGGAIVQSLNNHIMIVIERPNVQKPSNYAHTVGMPCNRVISLSGLSGFTKCANVDLSGINATPDELRMIKNLLENGVYL